MNRVARHVLLTTALAVSTSARAQAWPNRSIRIIVANATGGTVDLLARMLSDRLGSQLGVTFVVENRTGAGGNIAFEAAAAASPDGYTLLLAPEQITINPALYRRVNFDPVRSYAPVSLVAHIALVLVVPANSLTRTLPEFLARARREPGTINMAVAGIGSSGHMASAAPQAQLGTDWVDVPYRGGSTPINDLVAGNVDAAIVTLGGAVPVVQTGRALALGVTTLAEQPALPGVPPIALAAPAPGFDLPSYQALLAPAGTPSAIVERLNAAVDAALSDSAFRSRLKDAGFQPAGGPPDTLAAQLVSSVERWRTVTRTLQLRVD
jgi:tripartite-type tricarboxylate transporter receptor subunit TctC